MLKKKLIAMLTVLVFLFNVFGQGLTLAVETVVVNNEKEKTVKKLDITEKIVNKVAKKIENKTNDQEIKKQLKEKQKEIKKVVEQAKKEIASTNNVEEIKKKEKEVKKRVVLKLIDGVTKKEDAKENVEEIVKTPKEYMEALQTMKNMFEQGSNYSLIVKTKYSYKKFVGLLKKFDENMKPRKMFDQEGYTYYEITIPKNSIFAQEMLKDIRSFKIPKNFLGIKIVSPRIYKIEGDVEINGDAEDNKITKKQNNQITEIEGLDKTWGVKAYGIKNYINELKGKKKIKVAVIDTGIDPNHEDLRGNIGKGYDFINYDSIPEDEQGHGTHVAGTIAAVWNEKGIVGVNPNVEIVPLKICDANGFCPNYGIIKALDYIQEHPEIKVVNMSLGGRANPKDSDVCKGIKKVLDKGTVVVVAAGNGSTNAKNYVPGGCEGAWSVQALDEKHDLAYFSNYGENVLFGAPGVKIYSTYKGNNYKTLNGTSMASPHIAGVVSLLKELKPELSNEEIKQLMLENRGKNKYVDVNKITKKQNNEITKNTIDGNDGKSSIITDNKITEKQNNQITNDKITEKEDNGDEKMNENNGDDKLEDNQEDEKVEYKLTEKEKKKIEKDLEKENGIQIDVLELKTEENSTTGDNLTGNVKINSVKELDLPKEEDAEEIEEYYVNTGAIIDLNLLGSGTTQINSDTESEIEIKEIDKDSEMEEITEDESKDDQKIENLTGEELKSYLEKKVPNQNIKINSVEEKQEYILDDNQENGTGTILTGESLEEKQLLSGNNEIEITNILTGDVDLPEEKAPITKEEIENLEKERKSVKINSTEEENSSLILEEDEEEGTEINSEDEEGNDNQVYEILPSVQTGENEQIGVANSYYRNIKVGSRTRVYVPRARRYRYRFSSYGKIRIYRRGSWIKIYGLRSGRTTIYFKRRGRTYHRITVNVKGKPRKSINSLSWKYVKTKVGKYSRFRLRRSRNYRVYKSNNNIRVYQYRYGLKIKGLRKGTSYLYIKDRRGNRRYRIKVTITEDIRQLRLSTTNILKRKGYTSWIRIYDGNGGYKAYYDRHKVDVKIYDWGRNGRIRVYGKNQAIGNNYITVVDSKNQRKKIRYEILPQTRNYKLELNERENGYVNLNYAGYYTFKVGGTDKVSLYKERNRIRVYGKKAGTARIYIYYKNYYLGKIEVKVKSSYKVITLKKKIYTNKGLRIKLNNGWRYDVLRYDRNKVYVYKRRRSNRMRVYGKKEGETEIWLRSRYENTDYRIILKITKPKPLQASPTPEKIKDFPILLESFLIFCNFLKFFSLYSIAE